MFSFVLPFWSQWCRRCQRQNTFCDITDWRAANVTEHVGPQAAVQQQSCSVIQCWFALSVFQPTTWKYKYQVKRWKKVQYSYTALARVEPPTQVIKYQRFNCVSTKHFDIVTARARTQDKLMLWVTWVWRSAEERGVFVWLFSSNINKLSPES